MIKPNIGECTSCKQHTEIWEGYGDKCTNCFNDQQESKFTINGVPLVQVVEQILMERPIVKQIITCSMYERGVHRLLRLEEDGRIYKVNPEFHDQIIKNVDPSTASRAYVLPADPELIPKLNGFIDEHIGNCLFCKDIIENDTID